MCLPDDSARNDAKKALLVSQYFSDIRLRNASSDLHHKPLFLRDLSLKFIPSTAPPKVLVMTDRTPQFFPKRAFVCKSHSDESATSMWRVCGESMTRLRRVSDEPSTSKRQVRNDVDTRRRRKLGKQRRGLFNDCTKRWAPDSRNVPSEPFQNSLSFERLFLKVIPPGCSAAGACDTQHNIT